MSKYLASSRLRSGVPQLYRRRNGYQTLIYYFQIMQKMIFAPYALASSSAFSYIPLKTRCEKKKKKRKKKKLN